MSYSKSGMGGDHLFKGGVQFARLKYESNYDVLNGMYLIYNNGVPITVQRVQHADRLAEPRQHPRPFPAGRVDGRAGNLTLNLGLRYDHNTGTLPAQSAARRPFMRAAVVAESTPIKQNLAVWRAGLVLRPVGDGATALKASYSRYGLQVGIDRVTNVNPLTVGSRTCPWTDPNKDGVAQPSEIGTACTAFPSLTVHYAGANGPRWPYSDEITAGVERR